MVAGGGSVLAVWWFSAQFRHEQASQLEGLLFAKGNWLYEVTVRLAPGRNAAMIAFIAASSKIGGAKIVKMDKLREDIAKHIAQGYPLPEIAKNLPAGAD